ncbi:MAG: bis-aminopropyl spermidine synthase family protein [Sandaracinaceae bacterium]
MVASSELMALVERMLARDASAADAVIEEAALDALGLPAPAAGANPNDPSVGLWFVLRMASRTLRAAHVPPDPTRLSRLSSALVARPGRDEEHGQLAIDPPSTLRRAAVVRELAEGGPILAVGDDDALSVALALDGVRDVSALDIDPRLIAFLRSHGVSAELADVFHGSVPAALRGRFAAVITDPFRDLDGGVGFLSFAAACVRRAPAGRLLWVDHPDWNFEHHTVRATLTALGFDVTRTYEDLHGYPLPLSISEPQALAEAHGLDAGALERLSRRTLAWSHLLVLERR